MDTNEKASSNSVVISRTHESTKLHQSAELCHRAKVVRIAMENFKYLLLIVKSNFQQAFLTVDPATRAPFIHVASEDN